MINCCFTDFLIKSHLWTLGIYHPNQCMWGFCSSRACVSTVVQPFLDSFSSNKVYVKTRLEGNSCMRLIKSAERPENLTFAVRDLNNIFRSTYEDPSCFLFSCLRKKGCHCVGQEDRQFTHGPNARRVWLQVTCKIHQAFFDFYIISGQLGSLAAEYEMRSWYNFLVAASPAVALWYWTVIEQPHADTWC